MRKILLFLFLSVALFGADATIEIVNRGVVLPKISLKDESESSRFKDKFFKIMVGDLKVGSAFDVIENDINAPLSDLVLSYKLDSSGQNLSVRLINNRSNSIQYERTYSMDSSEKYPFLAHRAVADLARELKLSPIEWMDKMIVVSRYTTARNSEILLADYTLTYQKVVLRDGLNIFPKWANDSQTAFYFTSLKDSKPTLYKFDLKTGQRSKIIDGEGMIIASDVSKDGNKLLLTMAPEEQTDIFLYNLSSRNLTKLTNYKGIDVNGNFVENDSKIVFVSDRLGYPNIFSKSISQGSGVEQLVFHGRNNNSVSTHGNYIVYSSRESSSEFDPKAFNLYLISTKTEYIRQLTANGKNLYPRFSSDGGSIVFIKELGRESAVGIIRVNENKSFQFPLRIGKIQSIDW